MCSIRGMVEALAVPERTVRDHAVREIGLSPKRALRIMRLHRALLAARGPRPVVGRDCTDCGYADQAHLTRECLALLGDTPSQWMARGIADSFKTGTVTGW